MKNTLMPGMIFQLSQEGRVPNQPPLFAYITDVEGKLIEVQPIDDKGQFKLKSKGDAIRGASIAIAPELPGKKQDPSLEDLREIRAYEPVIQIDPKSKIQGLLAVPSELLKLWVWCFCRVRGRVEKDFCFWLSIPFPRKICFTLPVCPARVHICRIKPNIVWRTPDLDILRIKADLLKAIKQPFPPDPIGPISTLRPRLADVSARHSEGPVNVAVAAAQTTSKVASFSAPFSQSLQFKLQAESPDLIRRALVDHWAELRPLIPYFDWCSIFYRCDEFAVVDVDDQGRFDTWLFHDCAEQPDLYFWVEYLHNTQWVTVYKPSLCSGAHWNYACGSDVVLQVTDSRVLGCRPTMGRFLEVIRVGSAGMVPLVNTSTGLMHGVDYGNGTVDATGTPILGQDIERPFGGHLQVFGAFGDKLPDPALATHYRVSYKSTALTSTPANWKNINTPLLWKYVDQVNSKISEGFFDLADPLHSGFYKIPNPQAHLQAEIPKPAGLTSREWAMQGEVLIAELNTDAPLVAADTYDFRFELCRLVGGTMQAVTVPRECFEMPDPGNFLQSVFADAAHLSQTVPNGPNAEAFLLRLQIDTRRCSANIRDAQVDNVAADPQCGLLQIGTNARLAFEASHPANHATFSFVVVRGNGNDAGANTQGRVGAAATVNGYARIAPDFVNAALSVASMINKPVTGCNGAAFAESLYVAATATNGSSRQPQYDDSGLAAFAIIDSDCDCA